MNAKEKAEKLVMSIYSYAEMNSYEDNNIDDRLVQIFLLRYD